jgi:hypothetical protein
VEQGGAVVLTQTFTLWRARPNSTRKRGATEAPRFFSSGR